MFEKIYEFYSRYSLIVGNSSCSLIITGHIKVLLAGNMVTPLFTPLLCFNSYVKKKMEKWKGQSVIAREFYHFVFLAPVHGHWGRWSEWHPCSKTCNDGQIKRYRRCDNPKPQHGGRQCPGSGQEAKMCIVKRCHLGKWPDIHWYVRNHDHDSAAKLRLILGVRACQNSRMT